MRLTRIATVPLALAALAALSCSKSETGPSANLGTITCSSADASVCPPAGLALGFNGAAGSPSITPADASTSFSVTSSAYTVSGSTNSTTSGYWFLVVGGNLSAWGRIGVTGGTYYAEIPLFCGQQAVVYRFDNASGRSYWYANATLTGCSTPAFRAQLTWDTGPFSSDIDLHLVRPGGTPETQDDCYYSNCVPPDTLDWGAAGPTGNPTLDVDNTEGYGPENIILSNPQTGTYRVIVRNYNGVANTHATVKLFFNDIEQFRDTSVVLDSAHDYWTVATVDIQNKVITPVNTYSDTTPAVQVARAVAQPPKKKR
jgi:hypothetical protein